MKPNPLPSGMQALRGTGPGRSGGEGPGRFGGRGRYRGGRGQARGSQAGYGSSLKFAGACDGLKGMIYDCHNDKSGGLKPADTYVRTTQAVGIYMGSNCKFGMDIKSVIDNMRKPTYTLPTDLDPTTATEAEKMEFKALVEGIARQKGTLEENIGKLFSVVLGQCTEQLRERIKINQDYPSMSEKQDGLAVLTLIQKVCMDFEEHKFMPLAIMQMKKRYFGFCQDSGWTLLHYYTTFMNMQNALRNCEASTGFDIGVIKWMVKTIHGEAATPSP